MADSIQSKKNQQSYLRQIQQEKAQKKREIMQAQKEDLLAVRKYYTEQTKELETESAAAVNHIKTESKELAKQEQQERLEQKQYEAELRKQEREEKSGRVSQSSAESAEKKKPLFTPYK